MRGFFRGCSLGSLLIKYHVATLAMPSGAFEPWICEESFSRLCAWAV